MGEPRLKSAPWHAGEVALQRTVGVAERMAERGPIVVRDYLLDQHRAFFPLLPFVVLGAVDPGGDVWATLRSGAPGFLQAPDPHRLHVATRIDVDDPAERGLQEGLAVGALGIDMATKRRNRLNGHVRGKTTGGFDIAVEQSFGNCPKYIHPRDLVFTDDHQPAAAAIEEGQGRLDVPARALIAAAETFFVASYVDREDGSREVDVSHRGGDAGFVRIDEAGVLTIPDYAGNRYFNTLGNMLVNGKAGLVFPDFIGGGLLQIAGDARVSTDAPDPAAFPGAERLWRVTPRRMLFRPGVLALRSRADGGAQASK